MQGKLHKVVKTVRGKKGSVRRSYWVKSDQPTHQAQPAQWRTRAASIASVALPMIGGVIGEMVGSRRGAAHIANFAGNLSEHGEHMAINTGSQNSRVSMSRRAGSLAARGTGALLEHQSGNIGSWLGGTAGTAVGGALAHGMTRILLHQHGGQ